MGKGKRAVNVEAGMPKSTGTPGVERSLGAGFHWLVNRCGWQLEGLACRWYFSYCRGWGLPRFSQLLGVPAGFVMGTRQL